MNPMMTPEHQLCSVDVPVSTTYGGEDFPL